MQISTEKIKIPVIFHNLKGYDSHLIIEKLGEIIKKTDELIEEKVENTNRYCNYTGNNGLRQYTIKKIHERKVDINAIAANTEKCITLGIGKHLSFIDSFQFMSQSLAKLASNLLDDKYIYTSKVFQGEKLTLMKEKGVYPYDYMDNFEKFKESKLPSKKDFYSLLMDEDISEREYRHAQKVWKTFRIKNMGQYHNYFISQE